MLLSVRISTLYQFYDCFHRQSCGIGNLLRRYSQPLHLSGYLYTGFRPALLEALLETLGTALLKTLGTTLLKTLGTTLLETLGTTLLKTLGTTLLTAFLKTFQPAFFALSVDVILQDNNIVQMTIVCFQLTFGHPVEL